MAMIYMAQKTEHRKKSTFLSENGEVIEENEEFKRYKLSLENERMASRLDKKERRAKTALEILPSKILISFVSEYDAFLGSLVRTILEAKPEKLNSGEKQIPFSTLKDLESIDAAFNYIISKEVETLLRKSHSDQFDWLETLCSIPLRKGLDSWSTFIELTERRNLLVHCDGIVSEQYLQKCKKNGVTLSNEITIGSKLGVDRRYLDSVYHCLYEIPVKLTQVLWRKIFKDEVTDADASLINISFELIHEEQYELAQRLLDFGTKTLKSWGSDSSRRTLIINRAQAYYHDEQVSTCHEILNKEDWSSCSDDFQLCVKVLKENYEESREIMLRIGKSGPVAEADYIDWPVFRKFRDTKIFKKSFEEIFGKTPINTSDLVKDPNPEDIIGDLQAEELIH